MFSCVHQGNLHITPVPSKLTKYAQKTLYTKTPLSRGLIGKTFPDTEKKIKKTRNQTQILTGFAYWQPSNKQDAANIKKFKKEGTELRISGSIRKMCLQDCTPLYKHSLGGLKRHYRMIHDSIFQKLKLV